MFKRRLIAGLAGLLLVAAAAIVVTRGPKPIVRIPTDVACEPDCVSGIVRFQGDPLAHAEVLVVHRVPGAYEGSVRTGADGRFLVSHLDHDVYLQVRGVSLGISPRFAVVAGTGGVEVDLPPGGAVWGVVHGGDNGSATVRRYVRGMEVPTLRSAPLDELGYFWIGGLKPGVYSVAVELNDGDVTPETMYVDVFVGETTRIGPFQKRFDP